MEIERKYLVANVPAEGAAGQWTSLRQGYLASGPTGEVRLRDADGALTLTAKSGAGLVREEHEISLTPSQFDALWPLTEGRRVEKRRAVLPAGELRYELDVFEGVLTGLVVAEVEFASLEQARAFVAPSWFGREVTDDPRYTNASLALAGVPAAESGDIR
jgi:CYTH domain-containing protein